MQIVNDMLWDNTDRVWYVWTGRQYRVVTTKQAAQAAISGQRVYLGDDLQEVTQRWDNLFRDTKCIKHY
jgi:chemotaxis regulatin CheY-phosphate phosphatase CheZ